MLISNEWNYGDMENNNIKELSREIEIKDSILNFVKEILTAKEKEDNFTDYIKIDNFVSFVENDLRDALIKTKLYDQIEEDEKKYYFKEGIEKWALTEKKHWIKGKTSIAFIGEFSAGKTTIINKILSRDHDINLLPTQCKPTTAVPTYITGGKETNYSFFTPDNKLKAISEETFKRLSKDVLNQVDGVSSLIKYFVMTSDNKALENLSILDTPGFDSNDASDSEKTASVINECDVLFWVVDANDGGVNRSSLEIIKSIPHKPIYIVINKIDTMDATEIQDIQEELEAVFADSNVTIANYILFSKEEPLDTIMKPIMHLKSSLTYHDENFIFKLKNFIDKKVELEEKELKKEEKNKQEKKDKLDKWLEFLNNQIKRGKSDCDEITSNSIVKRLFSSDKIKNLVQRFKRDYERFPKIEESRIETVISYYGILGKYSDIKYKLYILKDCQKKLNSFNF